MCVQSSDEALTIKIISDNLSLKRCTTVFVFGHFHFEPNNFILFDVMTI